MKWLRLWNDLLESEKVQNLRPDLFKVWINLLCIANRHDPKGGRLPPIASLAFRLRTTEMKVAGWINDLVDLGFIEEGDPLKIHDWTHWQAPVDRTGAERQERWRERHPRIDDSRYVTRDVTGHVTRYQARHEDRYASVTPPVTSRVTLPRAREEIQESSSSSAPEEKKKDSCFPQSSGNNPRARRPSYGDQQAEKYRAITERDYSFLEELR